MPTLITSGGSVIPATPKGKSAATQLTGVGAASAGTSSEREPGVSASALAEPASERQRTTRFTTVSEADLRQGGRASDSGETRTTQWLAIGGLLLLGAAVIGGLIVVATRQPSADQLYAKVKTAAEGGAEQLVDVESQLTQFVTRFPDDRRHAEVEQYQEDLELYRLQRRFELRARRPGGSEELLPIERAYLEAVQLQPSDPGAALARFEALVAVYGGTPDPALSPLQTKAVERCLRLARGQADRLQESVSKLEQEQRQAIQQQLERAAQLAQTDRQAAEQIWQGIATLYGDKAWAAELVEQARLARTAEE
jgi:serine/threonine-protein kinase